jgi:hypothetical protein
MISCGYLGVELLMLSLVSFGGWRTFKFQIDNSGKIL